MNAPSKPLLFVSICALSAAQVFAGDYYWAGAAGTSATPSSTSNTSYYTTKDGPDSPAAAPATADTTVNIYLSNNYSSGNTARVSVASNFTWNKIEALNTDPAVTWDFFMNGRTVSLNEIVQASSGTIKLRKTNTGNAANVSVGKVTVSKGAVQLGGTANYADHSKDANSQYIQTLVLGNSSSTVGATDSVDITGGELSISSSSVTNYGNINISNGTMVLRLGIQRSSGGGNLSFTSPNFAMRAGDALNLGEGGNFSYSADTTNILSGTVSLDTVNATGTTASASVLNLYTSAATSGDVAPVNVAAINVGSVADTKDYMLQTNFASDAYIGALSASVGAGSTANVKITNTAGKTTTVNSVGSGLNDVEFSGGITRFNANFSIGGALKNGSTLYFDNGALTAEVRTVTVGGLEGGGLITNDYASDNGGTVINISGSGTHTYLGGIQDMAADSDAGSLGNASISLVKDGLGIQYLRGDNYFRGGITVAGGELHIAADKTSNGKTSNEWGVGKISMTGGALSATGAGELGGEVGRIDGTDLEWSGGSLIVDVDGSDYDKLVLSGDLINSNGAGDKFEIVMNMISYEADVTYDIIAFDDTTFAIEDFYVTLAGDVPVGMKLELSFDATGKILQGSFIPVPEPAQWAAIFGALALLIASRRKK